jgi:hypothetical protein
MYKSYKIIFTSLILVITHTLYTNYWFDIVPLQNFLQQHPEVSYIPCSDETYFEYTPFPLSINMSNHPNIGNFDKTYVLKIPNAQIQSRYGFVTYKNQFIEEFIWKKILIHLRLIQEIPSNNIICIPGKVAVISQLAYFNYWHWISEILCRLALLDMQNIEYDYVYVNQDSKFMRDTLELWGIDKEKIIAPTGDNFSIKADEVFLPSLVSNVDFGFAAFSCYAQSHLLQYVKEKLLTAALKYLPTASFSKKIFISRKDSSIRNIINEDEFFASLKPYGFERYELAKLSVIDQILLFNQAEIIVSPQGTGLANSIFCNSDVKIIELFQGLNDATFWYLMQDFKFKYTAVQTTHFQEDYVTAWQTPTKIPLEVIEIIKPLIQ